MKQLFVVGISLAAVLAGCTANRNASSVQGFQDRAPSTQYDQIKVQLARAVDDPYALPTLMTVGGSVVSTSSAGTLALERSATLSDHTNTVGLTLGGFSASYATSVNNALVSAKALQVMRDLYANALTGDPLRPEDMKALSNKPPAHRWFHHARQGTPPECRSCVFLGKFGGYRLYATSQRDYSDFALAVVEAASLKIASTTTTVKRKDGKLVKVTVPQIVHDEPKDKQNAAPAFILPSD